jgi:hypothetical protein
MLTFTRANGFINAGGLTMNFILDETRTALGRTQKNRFGSFWKIHWRKLFMAMEGGFSGGITQSFRDLFLFSCLALSNSKLQTKPRILII